MIDEGAEKFEPPLRVQARDRDKTSKITYSIVEGNKMGIFRIDSDSGEITIAKRAPVDMSNSTNGGDSISLTVQASDGTFSDKALISITVRDVNNNAPAFAHDLYTASIPELSPVGKQYIASLSRALPRILFNRRETVCSAIQFYIPIHAFLHKLLFFMNNVGTVVEELTATDADSGINAELVYRIQKGGFNDFAVNETSGAVFVSRKLDYDQRNTYHVEVIAFDKGIYRHFNLLNFRSCDINRMKMFV